MKKEEKPIQITPEIERRMRILANLVIDRLFDDKKNGTLKLKSTKKRVNAKENTT